MKIRSRVFLKEMIILTSIGLLWGCGVTSTPSSGNGSGTSSAAGVHLLSPGEIVQIQNQNAAASTPQKLEQQVQNMDDSDAIRALYTGLSDQDPAVRKKSQELLTTLISYDDRYLDELKSLQTENKNSDSWYSASLILKDSEKAKTRAREAEIQEMMKD